MDWPFPKILLPKHARLRVRHRISVSKPQEGNVLRFSLGVAAAAALLAEPLSLHANAQNPGPEAPAACEASREHPVAICFAAQPLTVDHCSRKAVPHFTVKTWREPGTTVVHYRYKYRLVHGATQDPEQLVGDRDDSLAFAFVDEDPDTAQQRAPYTDGVSYRLRVTVTTDRNTEASSDSPNEIPLIDKPHVQAFVIGVEKYVHPEFNLKHADADAKMFDRVLRGLLTSTADVRGTLATSDDTTTNWSRERIIQELQKTSDSVWGKEQWLCGDNDWFVFYYSGHGVIGSPNAASKNSSRFLSTREFDPQTLPQTTIKLRELLATVSGIEVANVVVILDSCFSGSQLARTADITTDGRGLRVIKPSSKLKYVSNGTIQEQYQVTNDTDSNAIGDYTRAMDDAKRAALVLAAAGAQGEAEEGFVWYEQTTDRGVVLKFTRSNEEKTSEQKTGGHGLFSYALVANLLKQLPTGTELSPILAKTRPAVGVAGCKLNFDAAITAVKYDVDGLGEGYQHPEGSPSRYPLAILNCSAPPPAAAVEGP